MKVCNLTSGSLLYTANAYLVTGTWNTLNDINTLVDVGRDPAIFKRLEQASTGVGKSRVEQVVLTHNHYDHASLLPEIIKVYKPKVYAYSNAIKGVDQILKGGEELRLGDRVFEVIHIPGHSNDSIGLYCQEDRVLFAGDAHLIVTATDSSFEAGFLQALEVICRKNIETIYFGHGEPVRHGCKEALRHSLKIVRKSRQQSND